MNSTTPVSPAAGAWPRLRQVCLAAPTLVPLVSQLRRLFGLGEPYADPHVAVWGLHNAVLPMGEQFLEVIAPVRTDSPVQRFLARQPAGGGYIVVLNDPALDARRRHLQALGVRLVTDLGVEGFHTLQVHPRDAGACLLEFNHTAGGEAADGPYLPAGPHWRAHVLRQRITGLAGVTLRGREPRALAERWSALTGVPLAEGERGPWLPLAGGGIEFAPPDGGAEGLTGVALQARDPAAVLADAAALGLAHDRAAATVRLGGVEFRLLPTPAGAGI